METTAPITITATPGTSTNVNVRAPINGLQIVRALVTPPVALENPLTISGIGAGQGYHLGRPAPLDASGKTPELVADGVAAWRQSIGLSAVS